jgi:hypothetical protein
MHAPQIRPAPGHPSRLPSGGIHKPPVGVGDEMYSTRLHDRGMSVVRTSSCGWPSELSWPVAARSGRRKKAAREASSGHGGRSLLRQANYYSYYYYY